MTLINWAGRIFGRVIGGVLLTMSGPASACYGVDECAPIPLPIVDRSGMAPKTAEARQVRKAADHFLRMELSGLMTETGYEGPEAFAFIAKKYLAVSQAEWKKQDDARLRTNGVVQRYYICDRARLTGVRQIRESSVKQVVSYQVDVIAEVKGRANPTEMEFREFSSTADFRIALVPDERRWKVSELEVTLRMDLSGLMWEGGYEGREAFAPIAEKYLEIPPEEWARILRSAPIGYWVCDKPIVLAGYSVRNEDFHFVYHLQSVARVSGRMSPQEIELVDDPRIIRINYHLRRKSDRWKVFQVSVEPHSGYSPVSEIAPWLRPLLKPSKDPRIGVSKEESEAARRLYDQLVVAERKYCK